MPSDDVLLNVRQIASYPVTPAAAPGDFVVLQRGGLGGPYYSTSAEAFVTGALAEGGPLTVSAPFPSPALGDPAQIFTGAFIMPSSTSGVGAIFWNAYWDGSARRYWASSSAAALNFDPVSGFQFQAAPSGAADAMMSLTELMTLSATGALTLRAGTLTVSRDPLAAMEVATQNYVTTQISQMSASTQAQVCGLKSYIDTVSAYILSLPAVSSFNGRSGAVQLMGADVQGVLSAGGFTTVTPPATDSSNQLATTNFVQGAIAGGLSGVYAPIASPAFTGVPTAPTATAGDSSGTLATTAFVHNAVTASTSGVASFNTRTGAVVLTGADITGAGGAPLASPALTGVPTGPTAAPGTNTTQLATCAFVEAMGGVSSFNTRTGAVSLAAADVTGVGGALLAGPAFTGVPSAPTATAGTSTTQLATCAFVAAAVAASVVTFNGRAGAVTFQANDVSAVGGALLASPAFTGAPTAPTQTTGTSNTTLATTAFVAAAIAAVGTGVVSFNTRAGAVTLQTSDISGAGGALLASPTFTGVPAGPTASPGTNTTQLATTGFVAASFAPLASPTFTGTVTIPSGASIAGYAPLASPTFTGTTTTAGISASSINVSGLITPSSTGIKGVTDGSNAPAGSLGEYLRADLASGSAFAVTSGTNVNVVSLSLTAGDWDVKAVVNWPAVPSGASSAAAGISTTTAAFPADQLGVTQLGVTGGTTLIAAFTRLPIGPVRISVSATTTVYLVASLTFASGSPTVCGSIGARRIR